MTLREKQSKFTQYVGMLILFAYSLGYELTFGDAARIDNQGHVEGSYHYKRLAVDLNLFVDDKYKDKYCPEWQKLGTFWKMLDKDCTWGGDFKRVKDLNHFSYGEK